MAFSMIVKQVFNFADGRTILTGPVEGDVASIQPGRYGLFQDKILVREVEVEGEMMPRTTQRSPRARCIHSRANWLAISRGADSCLLT